jgi:hypothetical protein
LLDTVFNGPWKEQVKYMLPSLHGVGWAVVAYGPNPEHDNELIPRVLEPTDYILEWQYDQNGNRYYTPRPDKWLRELNDIDEFGRPIFKAADVFFMDEPSASGEIQSKARAIIDKLVLVDQLLTDYRLVAHGHQNQPLVIESPDTSKNERITPPGFRSERQVAAYGGGITSQAESLTGSEAMRNLGIHSFTLAGERAAAAKIQQSMVQRSIAASAKSAKLTDMEVVNEYSGLIEFVSPEQTWMRNLLNLPPGSVVSNVSAPSLPNEYREVLNLNISMCCVTFGIPPELILGTHGGGAKVTTATLSQEQLRSTVMNLRDRLEKVMESMYWRTYGGQGHILHLGDALAEEGVELTEEDAIRAVENMSVKFLFRQDALTLEVAQSLYSSGLLEPDALMRFVMQKYGLSYKDVKRPLTTEEKMEYDLKLREKYGSPANPAKSEKTETKDLKQKQMGDIGQGDVKSVGFSGSTRNPSKTSGVAIS